MSANITTTTTTTIITIIIITISHCYSFRLFLYRLFKSTAAQKSSRHSTDTVSEFHAEAPQATVNERRVQGPYVAARARFEPATLRMKGVESTNAPPRTTIIIIIIMALRYFIPTET